MLARFFKKTDPINFVMVVLLLLVYIFLSFFLRGTNSLIITMSFQFIGVLFFFIFVLLLGDFIVNKNKLTDKNNYFILFFVLLIGFFPDVLIVNKIGFSHLFILLSARRFYSLYRSKGRASKLFDSGFYIGIAFLLYPISILYLALVYIAYFLFIKVITKKLFAPLIGFLTPVFVSYSYHVYTDNYKGLTNSLEMNLGYNYVNFNNAFFLNIFMVLITLTTLSIIVNYMKRQQMGNKEKNSFFLLNIHLLISFVILFIHSEGVMGAIQFTFFPLAIVFANSFSKINNIYIQEGIAYSLLVLSLLLFFIN